MGAQVSAAVSTEPFRIRAGSLEDRAYVLKSWFEGARATTNWCLGDGHVFFAEHGRVLEAILERAVVRVAHVPSESAAILGFAVLEPDAAPPVLHWVHVRGQCRGQGIARALLSGILSRPEVHCSHWPLHGRVPSNFRFNPYRLFPR